MAALLGCVDGTEPGSIKNSPAIVKRGGGHGHSHYRPYDLKTVKGVRAEPSVSDNGFSLTFSRKGFKCQTFERRDPAAGTRVPASRNH
jgi:hypothetical protein